MVILFFKKNYALQFYVVLLVFYVLLMLKIQVLLQVQREIDQYISDLKNKNIAIVANQTTIIKKEHLVDVLLNEGVNVQKVFSPEHGFRGKSDAGEKVKDEFDLQTGLPIYSLYGKAKRENPVKNYLKMLI